MRSLAALVLCLTPLALRAQAPAPAKFELVSTSGQTTFHIGEVIPLTLRFTGPPDTYNITLFNFGRTDPLFLDRFSVEPGGGWTDSLAEYSAFRGGGCCGAKQAGVLSAKPHDLEVNLNEWVRFDTPGTYTISIATHRVTLVSSKKSSIFDFSDAAFNLRSNSLQIRIIPATPPWQKQTFEHAILELNKPHEQYGETSPARLRASADIRYLATPESIQFLASHLRDEDWNLAQQAQQGLIGLPSSQRDLALSAMKKLIDDPSFPVSEDFLATFPFMQLADIDPPPSDLFTGAFNEDRFRSLAAAHEAAVEPLFDAAWEDTARALPRKTEAARSVTGETILKRQPARPSQDALRQIGALMRESFPKLPHNEQATLLSDSWDIIGDRSLIPQLRSLAKIHTSPASAGMPTFLDAEQGVHSIALQRWYEFEPESALAEIQHQISSASPSLSAAELDYLPEKQTFPQFERLWAKAFCDANGSQDYQLSDTLGSLLVRFGTGSAAPQLETLILKEGPALDGNRKGPAFTYLLRFDPDFAKRLIEQQNAVLPTKELQYPGVSLQTLTKGGSMLLLNDLALSALNSNNPNTVSDAIDFLGEYGDDRARKPLLDLYLKSTATLMAAESAAKATEVTEAPPGDLRNPEQTASDLAKALLAGQGWVADPALIATVQQHCATEKLCVEVKKLSTQDRHLNVSYEPHEVEVYLGWQRIPSLALFEAKLDQYPKGTSFILDSVSSPFPGSERQFQTTLPALFTQHGMILQTAAK